MSCAKDNRTLLWDLFSLKPVYELSPGAGEAAASVRSGFGDRGKSGKRQNMGGMGGVPDRPFLAHRFLSNLWLDLSGFCRVFRGGVSFFLCLRNRVTDESISCARPLRPWYTSVFSHCPRSRLLSFFHFFFFGGGGGGHLALIVFPVCIVLTRY